jgi:hypothetical protein
MGAMIAVSAPPLKMRLGSEKSVAFGALDAEID